MMYAHAPEEVRVVKLLVPSKFTSKLGKFSGLAMKAPPRSFCHCNSNMLVGYASKYRTKQTTVD